MTEKKKLERLAKNLATLEALKLHSLMVFDAAHRLARDVLEPDTDGFKNHRKAVVIEFKRLLEKRQK